jgi:hypothetical protein
MNLEVSDASLRITLTDPVIVEAAKEALRTVNARAAEVEGEAGGSPAAAPAATTVIRGDLPAAAGLAKVWLELRKTLATLAETTPVKLAVKPPENPEEPPGDEPEAGAATS